MQFVNITLLNIVVEFYFYIYHVMEVFITLPLWEEAHTGMNNMNIVINATMNNASYIF